MAYTKKDQSKSKMTELKNQLSDNKLMPLYLFYGEEEFLINLNIDKIKKLVPHNDFEDFNRIILNGADCSLAQVADALDTFPMMADRKLVIIKDSGAFGAKAAAEVREFYTEKIENLQEDTVLIFKETSVDKRSAVYKAAMKKGWVGEFTRLDDMDLVTWLIREARARKRKLDRDNAAYMVQMTDRSLQTLKNELEKVCAYTEEEITKPAIDKLVSRSLEARVFDLCDAMMNKDADKSLIMLSDLKTNKESPYGILYILYTTFSKMLMARMLMERNEPEEAFAEALSVPKFSVRKYVSGARKFTKQELSQKLMLITETDLAIKRGETEQWQGVERFIRSVF